MSEPQPFPDQPPADQPPAPAASPAPAPAPAPQPPAGESHPSPEERCLRAEEARLEAAAGVAACTAAHRVLLQRLVGLDDATARRPSLLAGWSVGHVLTHLSRNAEGITRWLEGALAGVAAARYPGGREQRDRDIETGARRPAPELLDQLWRSCTALDQAWARSALAGWPDDDPPAPDAPWPTAESPWRRMIEVEIHHSDLGLGFHAGEWSEELVGWLLPRRLARLDKQVTDPAERRRLLSWLVGRTDEPGLGRLTF